MRVCVPVNFGSRHAWWPKFGKIDPLEGAILGVSAEISQISDAQG